MRDKGEGEIEGERQRQRQSSANCHWTGPGQRSGRSGRPVEGIREWPCGIRVGTAALIVADVLRSEQTSDGQAAHDTGRRRLTNQLPSGIEGKDRGV